MPLLFGELLGRLDCFLGFYRELIRTKGHADLRYAAGPMGSESDGEPLVQVRVGKVCARFPNILYPNE